MKVIQAMPKTEISVEDGVVSIMQTVNYSDKTVTFPLEMLEQIYQGVLAEAELSLMNKCAADGVAS